MATDIEIKNVFLSASIPLPQRDPKYIETADIIAIRDAIIALVTTVIPYCRIIWGGHPSITPLIYYVMNKMDLNIHDRVTLYQSKLFERSFPEDNNKFKNVIITDIIGNDLDKSLLHMRTRMFNEYNYSAAIFIGGMVGIEIEFKLFRKFHPNALVLPVASTGAASKIVYDKLLPKKFRNDRLINDFAYMSLFQKLLIDKI